MSDPIAEGPAVDEPGPSVVPVAATLHLCCPTCGTQLQDRIGPFWCPKCQAEVSAWPFVAALIATAAERKSYWGIYADPR